MTEYRGSRPRDRWKRLSILVMGFGLLSLFAAGVLLVFTLTGSIGATGSTQIGTRAAFGESIQAALTPIATPTIPRPTPDVSAIGELIIPKFAVDAPVQIKGIDANNVMQSPDGPAQVAWYNFSSKPGYVGNAVFAGHVDYHNYGAAVFWHLKDLVVGDTIEVHLQDGTAYKYAVTGGQSVSSDPTAQELSTIVGQTPQEIITLITCGGTFNYSTHEYDHRTIVRAARVLEPARARAQ